MNRGHVSDQPPYPPPNMPPQPPPPGGLGQQPYGSQPGYGQQQPYGSQPGYGQQPGYGAPGPAGGGQLAEWPQRALALLVDAGIVIAAEIALVIVGLVLTAIVRPLGSLFLIVSYLAVIAYFILQLVKQGNTGQTVGKKIVGLKLIKEETGQPVGGGMSVVRYIAHVIDSAICYIGWLFPLWDAKKQTIADKLIGTVVVTVPKQPFSTADLYTVS